MLSKLMKFKSYEQGSGGKAPSRWAIFAISLNLYIAGYFYTLFAPGRGGKFAPLSKNRLVSDRIEIFCLLMLFFVKLIKKIFGGCDVTKTMMTSSKPVNPYNSMKNLPKCSKILVLV